MIKFIFLINGLKFQVIKKGEIKKFSDWFCLIHKDDKQNVEMIFEKIFDEKKEKILFVNID